MNKQNGKVYFVGAGPGPRALLTIKAYELILLADVIVYDRLVSEEILDLIPLNVEKIDVGKNSGYHKVTQSKINQILLEKALAGKNVVRLKGGDPFLFGRGGEELELLSSNEIDFQVVPGITSAISAPAYGGIPVTHREFSSSLHIITGHTKENCELSIDFESLVKLNGTLVFLMSVANINLIVKGLINGKMDCNMPCAVIENGTRYNQRKFVSTIEKICDVVKKNLVVSPATIVVGKVCDLSEKFDWFDKLSLKGAKILVTRPENMASQLCTKLNDLGANAKEYPCIKIKEKEIISMNFSGSTWIIFTSGVGVKIFFNYLKENKMDFRILKNLKFAVVGSRTGEELMKFGIIPDFIPSVFDGEHLAKEILLNGFVKSGENIIIIRGKNTTDNIIQIFEKKGVKVQEYKIYETEYVNNAHIKLSDYDFITFTSESCVKGFMKCYNGKPNGNIKAVCIGEGTENLAKKCGFNTCKSDIKTIDSMVLKIMEVY